MEGRTGADLLMGERGADPLVIEVGEKRQKIEGSVPGRVRRKVIRRQFRQVGPVVGREHLSGIVLRKFWWESVGEPPATSSNLLPETFAHDEESLEEGRNCRRVETRWIDVEMEAKRVQEHRPSPMRPGGTQDIDESVHLWQSGDRQRSRDEFPRHEGGYHRTQPRRCPPVQLQAEARVALRMQITEVGLDSHIAEAGIKNPEGMRILDIN